MDVPGFVNTFTPDGTFTDEAFGNVFTGPKELAIMLQVFGNAFPDMHRELHRFYSVDDMVIVELALQGTHNGPLAVPGGFIPPTGRRMNAPCCDAFRIVDENQNVQLLLVSGYGSRAARGAWESRRRREEGRLMRAIPSCMRALVVDQRCRSERRFPPFIADWILSRSSSPLAHPRDAP
jgi:hypothetical protein